MSFRMAKEWVALFTFDDEWNETFCEAGAIYPYEPRGKGMIAARGFDPSEPVALCPRCGQRFAATEDGTAESHRDLHFNGDPDIPPICWEPEHAMGGSAGNIDLREMRRQGSAIKAQDCYHETRTRGLLLTRALPPTDPFIQGFAGMGGRLRAWENSWVTLQELRERNVPSDVVALVETYNPEKEAIVVIEYEPGGPQHPEVVPIAEGGRAREVSRGSDTSVTYKLAIVGGRLPEDDSLCLDQTQKLARIVRHWSGDQVGPWEYHFTTFDDAQKAAREIRRMGLAFDRVDVTTVDSSTGKDVLQ